MNQQTCVARHDLADFLRGELPHEKFEGISAHVDTCDLCQETVSELATQSDVFLDSLRMSADTPDAFSQEEELRDGLRRASLAAKQSNENSPSHHAPAMGRIGPYQLEEQLGVGAMGTVFRATHTKLKRTVALKVLPSHRWTNTISISRFEREMEAIGQLDHPNIVRASDAGEADGMHFLVMEFVDGLDLSRLTRRVGSLSIPDACEIARQIAIGLAHAHAYRLIHRDIKPSNVMLAWEKKPQLTSRGRATVKILDLGLALLGDEHLREGNELTTVGQLMGTLDYMSPEQGVDSHAVDHRTDLYSLGATLFKLLSGRAPYAEQRYGTLMKKMTALATKPAPSLASVRNDVPQEVTRIVDRLLSRDPDERFETSEEVAETLLPHCEQADLATLLKRGLASDDHCDAAIPAASSQPHPLVVPQPTSPSTADSGNSFRNTLRWLAAGAFMLAAGIIFRIATDQGTVVLKSDDINAKVALKRNDHVVDQLQIAADKGSTRVYSGAYVVELVGESSGLELRTDKIEVARGKQVEISVVSTVNARDATTPADKRSTGDQDDEESIEKRVADKTYHEWDSVLRTNADPGSLDQPVRSMAILANGEERTRDVATKIMKLMKVNGMGYPVGNKSNRHRLSDTCEAALLRLDSKITTDVLLGHVVERGKTRALKAFLSRFANPRWMRALTEPWNHYGDVTPEDARAFVDRIRTHSSVILEQILEEMEANSDPWLNRWLLQFSASYFDVSFHPLPDDARQVVLKYRKLGNKTANSLTYVRIPETEGLAEELWDAVAEHLDRSKSLQGLDTDVRLLAELGEYAQPAVKPIVQYIEENAHNIESETLEVLLWTLASLGPNARDARPTLERMLEPSNSTDSDGQGTRARQKELTPTLENSVRKTLKAISSEAVDDSVTLAAANQPQYNDKTLGEWIALANVEQNPEKLLEAMQAIENLGQHPANQHLTREAIGSVIKVLQRYGAIHGPRDIYRVKMAASKGILMLPTKEVVEALVAETSDTKVNNVHHVFDHITYYVAGGEFKISREQFEDRLTKFAEHVAKSEKFKRLNEGDSRTLSQNLLGAIADTTNPATLRLELLDFVLALQERASFSHGIGMGDEELAETLWKLVDASEPNLLVRATAMDVIPKYTVTGAYFEFAAMLRQLTKALAQPDVLDRHAAVRRLIAAADNLSTHIQYGQREEYEQARKDTATAVLQLFELSSMATDEELMRSGGHLGTEGLVKTLGRLGTSASFALPKLFELRADPESRMSLQTLQHAIHRLEGFVESEKLADIVLAENYKKLLDDNELADGKSLPEWLLTLRDNPPEGELIPILQQIAKLSDLPANRKFGVAACETIFTLMRKYGTRWYPDDSVSAKMSWASFQALKSIPKDAVVECVTAELLQPTSDPFGRFLLSLLDPQCFEEMGWDDPTIWLERRFNECFLLRRPMDVAQSSEFVARLNLQLPELFAAEKDKEKLDVFFRFLAQWSKGESAASPPFVLLLRHRRFLNSHHLATPGTIQSRISQSLGSPVRNIDDAFAAVAIRPSVRNLMQDKFIKTLALSYNYETERRRKDGAIKFGKRRSDARGRRDILAGRWFIRDFRLQAINALGKLGAQAEDALDLLQEIATENPDLTEAANQAIEAIRN